jgi:hypothetical protein
MKGNRKDIGSLPKGAKLRDTDINYIHLGTAPRLHVKPSQVHEKSFHVTRIQLI